MTCRVCHWQKVWRQHRCRACWMYRYRNGRDRPEELVVRHGRRILMRRFVQSG